jgi:hypothetical protein
MQTAIVQNVPLAVLALAFNSYGFEGRVLATGSAATMELRASCGMPTDSSAFSTFAIPSAIGTESGLSMIAIAKAALPDSRPLADWERKDADEFFWSQFK